MQEQCQWTIFLVEQFLRRVSDVVLSARLLTIIPDVFGSSNDCQECSHPKTNVRGEINLRLFPTEQSIYTELFLFLPPLALIRSLPVELTCSVGVEVVAVVFVRNG